MFGEKPKFPFPDLGDMSFGEVIAELEKQGLMGHFKDVFLFSSFSDAGEGLCITRDYWSMAGTDPTQIYKEHLGNEKTVINNIEDSIVCLKKVINSLTMKFQELIKANNSDYLLRKLIVLFNATYEIYIRDRHTRETLVENNWNSPTDTYEENRNITLSILSGLNLMIENCIVSGTSAENKCRDTSKKCFDELVDVELLTNVYLYSLASQYYTLLNVSKKSKNYKYCSGIVLSLNDNIPIEGIIHHPVIYSNTMLSGNVDSILPSDETNYLKQADSTDIGKGFKQLNGIEFTEAMKCMYSCRENLCKQDKKLAKVITLEQLKDFLLTWYPDVRIDRFIEAFVLDEKMLKEYVTEAEPFIYKMGCNKNRLEIRPIIKLNNNMVYMSYALLDRAINLWYSYLVNGGRPYTSIEPGQGDFLIDGCRQRENELGDVVVNILVSMLEKHYPAPKFKGIDVDYDKIFKKRTENYGDFDIIYYFEDELYLIESKYFSDSYTGNTIIGDYNKLFVQKKNYYKHCRGRYDLVIAEPDAIKSYIGASGDINVHFLFVSSKPLEVEFQDRDGVVTFLSIANFEMYLQGRLLSEDGTILRPTYKI